MENLTFIGDIHSASDDLKILLEDPVINQSKIIFLGDYIDGFRERVNTNVSKFNMDIGPEVNVSLQNIMDPLGVIDIVMDRVENHGDVALLGNHEDFWLQTAYGDDFTFQIWKINGGKQTWKNLKIKGSSLVAVSNALIEGDLKRYTDFIKRLPLTWENQNILAVHAGINWDYPLKEQTREDMLWIRKKYLVDDDKWWHKNELGKIIVTGHTPVQSIQGAMVDFVRMQASDDDVIRYLIDSGSRSDALNGGILGLTLDEDGNEVQVRKVVDSQMFDLRD